MNENKIEQLAAQGKICIKKYSKKAMKATFFPFVSIPLVHGMCIAMQSELNALFGVGKAKSESASNIALGVAATPFIAIPLFGAISAVAYVETVGESYLKALIAMYRSSGI